MRIFTKYLLLAFMLMCIQVKAAFAVPVTPVPAATATDAPAEKPAEVVLKDEFERDTPRSMIKGFLQALTDQDYNRAANFIDISDLAKAQQKDPADIAKRFHTLLDQNGWIISRNNISDDPRGELEDNLPPELEKIGGIRTSKKVVPILAEKIPATEDKASYWIISSETIQQLATLEKDIKTSFLNKYLPQTLINNQVEGVPLGHWLALMLVIVGTYALVWTVSVLVITSVCHVNSKLFSKETNKELLKLFISPVKIFLTIAISFFIIRSLGISLLARQIFFQFAQVILWITFAVVIWRLIDFFAELLKKKLISRGQYDVISAIVLLRRGTKLVLLLILFISILDNFGFQITTWIAALGVGGIAIALGTQKTVENFVGSLTIIADRPIAIGDFCRFGDAKGTVEDIGMRSTRVRTPDRTIITIPNGAFSSMQIENYTKRDSYFYNVALRFHYNTTADQIRHFIEDIKQAMKDHPKVNQASAKAFFSQVGTYSLNVEANCYIQASNSDEASAVTEELNLKVIELMEKAGIKFALAEQNGFVTKV